MASLPCQMSVLFLQHSRENCSSRNVSTNRHLQSKEMSRKTAVSASPKALKESAEDDRASQDSFGRRNVFLTLVATSTAVVLPEVNSSFAADNFALLGAADESKTKNLSIVELKEVIKRDISVGQYFITGDLTRSIYRDDCRFKDPTNDTKGLDKYLQAVSILFDPAVSKQELLSIEVTGPNTIEARWTLGGFLKFPWRPRVATFEGSTSYTIDPEGLVMTHDEKWSISPLTAIIETFTPNFRLL